MSQFTLVIHGGAGNIHRKRMSEVQESAHSKVLVAALTAGEVILSDGGDAVSAVEAAICVLENSPLFNAGKGSVFTMAGTQEMDAAIMEGKDRNAGGVACIGHIRNPISAARAVMEKSPHVLICGTGAEQFARTHNVEWAEPHYFFDQHRWNQLEQIRGTGKMQLDFEGDEETKPESDKYGTVGAVACDSQGNLAAGTSTGGLTNKMPGRIGDTSMIGAGVFADNASCAVSCTGQGEYFMRGLVAADVANRMKFGGAPMDEAAQAAIDSTLSNLGGKGGVIAVDRHGNFSMPFNTTGMFRGYLKGETGKDSCTRAVYMFR
ncbi:MAG: isoaspartyl peptidase/L-asparaginase [Alphaproteobacteria bacterium]|nr:isoaspartyl peptidase/L-asparaginase [Alphaproteobacteria bacterium]